MAGRAALEVVGAGLRVHLRVTPKASRNAIQGLMPGPDDSELLKVAVTTVPEDGKANAAVIALLAKSWRLPKSSLTLVAGHTDRSKVVEIAGDGAELRDRIAALIAAP